MSSLEPRSGLELSAGSGHPRALSARAPAKRIDDAATALTKRRYDRIAPIYDALEWMMELRARRWRRELWALADGARILEVGVGTGKNLRYHPKEAELVAIDISPRMLQRAEARAAKLESEATLMIADAQALPFEDSCFDTVVSTFVFCSVPDPLIGLREARRVLKPGGQLLLLEHVMSEMVILRTLMRWMDPLTVRIWGAHVNRPTVQNVRNAGFLDVAVTRRSLDIVKQIVARAPA